MRRWGSVRKLLGFPGLLGLTALALVATGCQGDAGISKTAGTAAALPGIEAMSKATLTVSPAGGAENVRLDKPLEVSVRDGLLTDVSVTREGEPVSGTFDASKSTWQADSALLPSSKYRVRAEAINADGATSTTSDSFETLVPDKVLDADVTPNDGETVGVGMPLVVTFDHAVKDKAAVEKRLRVETSKPVEGAWHWFTDSEVHYRPKEYWPAHTDVTVDVDTRGVNAGNGVWGVDDRTERFTIGRSIVTKVDLHEHQAKTYVDGELANTAPVTGGKPGWETRDGIKVIIGKEPWKRFTNEMIDAAEDYDLISQYALRVTVSGEFVHTATWSEGSHGYANVSHGCVGMNTENSGWLYNLAQIGDPVEMDTDGPPMETYGNGYGDWNISWKEWKAGSALAS